MKHGDNWVAEMPRRDFLTRTSAVLAGTVMAVGLSAADSKAYAATVGNPVAKASDKNAGSIARCKGHLMFDPTYCAGCNTCQISCVMSKEGVVNPLHARIQLFTDLPGGAITSVWPCQQCEGPECLMACPNGALYVDPETCARVIDESICVGCQLCLNACPLTPHRIRYDQVRNVCIKCDLCGGDPKCVKYCPQGALTYVEEDV